MRCWLKGRYAAAYVAFYVYFEERRLEAEEYVAIGKSGLLSSPPEPGFWTLELRTTQMPNHRGGEAHRKPSALPESMIINMTYGQSGTMCP